MVYDAHADLAAGTVAGGTCLGNTNPGTIVVATGQGTLAPAGAFTLLLWPPGVYPTFAGAELAHVSGVAGDVFTIDTRATGATAQAAIAAGWQWAAPFTAAHLLAVEQAITAETSRAQTAEGLLAPIASPTFTGLAIAPALEASGLTGATTPTRYVGGTTGGPPVSGTYVAGDFVVTTNGDVFVCITGGSPGTWQLVGLTDPNGFHPKAGDWGTAAAGASNGANIVFLAANDLLLVPRYVGGPGHANAPYAITALGLIVTTIYTSATANAYLSVYSSDTRGYPNAIQGAETSAIDLKTTTGLKQQSGLTISLAQPGKYWFGVRTDATAPTAGQIRAMTNGNPGVPFIGTPDATNLGVPGALRVTGQSSAPSSLAAATFTTIQNAPVVQFKG